MEDKNKLKVKNKILSGYSFYNKIDLRVMFIYLKEPMKYKIQLPCIIKYYTDISIGNFYEKS